MKRFEFIENEIWKSTIAAAFQRSNVYANPDKGSVRQNFKKSIHARIKILVEQEYMNKQVQSEKHISNLLILQDWITTHHHRILKNGEMKLGIVQKLLNLYLKYRWCLTPDFPEPPHCPLDRIIIWKLNLSTSVNWTELDDIDVYRDLIGTVTQKAGNKSIAIWELEEYEGNR